ncbi:NAD(P)H-quinone oxidoreductase [Alicyclobacillus fastidiosus]|uniref:NAD(P)H-quinone oxidoreductase n=1 Tax=Alicyclobacillus fastidiosus TaxID=392011 RepID=A0ABV5AL41_9BACL|nr:NAD(P)H-quinone oxidoreductase [Alicyclobacillus fastidiosus]WEH09384.1 NAD(P)H-quinone oxidoreductase [Alicyclobacillus fastidiosus]
MKAVLLSDFGGPEVLHIGEVDVPSPGPGEVLVRVRATALNRADLLQRRGLYPAPQGASDILGLEMAGEVEQVGDGVSSVAVGDRVCALLPGGGYAQYVCVPAGMLMKLPSRLTFAQGAAIPEAFLTAYLNVFSLGNLAPGETVLVHAGASGVGTSAIQLIRLAGARSIVTAGSSVKLERCMSLGAEAGWNYHEGSFVPFVEEQTGGDGVNMILDFVGAPYFEANISSLAVDGRLIIIGTMGGAEVQGVNLGTLLARRLQVIGTALRSRSVATKIELTQAFQTFAGNALANGEIAPVIDSVFDWKDVQDAHRYMESNKNIGKIVLNIGE